MSFSGKHVAVTGKINSMSRSNVQSAITKLGGTYSPTVNKATDLLIVGNNPGKALHAAGVRGIAKMEHDNFLALVRGEQLPAPAAPEPPDQAPTNLKSLALHTASAEAWTALVEALDTLPEGQLAAAVAAIRPQIDAWDDQPMGTWRPSDPSAVAFDWDNNVPTGDVRVAPYHWTEQILQQTASPKWALVRVLHCYNMKLTSKIAQNIFTCPHLDGVQRLSLNRNRKLTKTFYSKLRQSERMRTLTHLYFDSSSSDKVLAGLQGPHQLSSLRTIHFPSNEGFDSLFGAECFENVKELTGVNYGAAMQALQRAGASLEVLRIERVSQYFVEAMGAPEQLTVLNSLEMLELGFDYSVEASNIATFLQVPLDGVTELRLRGDRKEGVTEEVVDIILNAKLPALQRLVAGGELSESMKARVEADGIELC